MGWIGWGSEVFRVNSIYRVLLSILSDLTCGRCCARFSSFRCELVQRTGM
jgi:hypothetical protein